MKYCKKCIQPDTRPSVQFGEDGVCPACRLSVVPDNEWQKRQSELHSIVKWAKAESSGFDCITGVSGGKDSHFQAHYLRDTLGLKVLLVNLMPDGITDVGRRNLENLVQHGFDIIYYRCNPIIWKEVTKQSFFKYGNPVKPSEYPLYAVSYQEALNRGIPLVVQGENPAITMGSVKDLPADGDALNVNQLQTLNGCNANDWLYDGVTLKDLIFYQFPDKPLMRKNGMKAIFLNYYVKEYGELHNTQFAKEKGLLPRPNHDPYKAGRLNPYGSIDSDLQIVNQMIKYYKFGFGFVTDEVCRYIRDGVMTREEAINKVEQYDGKCDSSYIQQFCDYINITWDEFWTTVDKFVDTRLFTKIDGVWQPRFKVGTGIVD